jgi:hypothetical protein
MKKHTAPTNVPRLDSSAFRSYLCPRRASRALTITLARSATCTGRRHDIGRNGRDATASRTTSPRVTSAQPEEVRHSPRAGHRTQQHFRLASDEHGGTITHKPEADYLDDGSESWSGYGTGSVGVRSLAGNSRSVRPGATS